MTREEASFILANIDRRVCDDELNEALDMAIKALEQEPKAEQFARWVAKELFDEMWEDNPNAFDGFAELVCRKLEKLGIVRAIDDEWELVESQEEVDDYRDKLDELEREEYYESKYRKEQE